MPGYLTWPTEKDHCGFVLAKDFGWHLHIEPRTPCCDSVFEVKHQPWKHQQSHREVMQTTEHHKHKRAWHMSEVEVVVETPSHVLSWEQSQDDHRKSCDNAKPIDESFEVPAGILPFITRHCQWNARDEEVVPATPHQVVHNEGKWVQQGESNHPPSSNSMQRNHAGVFQAVPIWQDWATWDYKQEDAQISCGCPSSDDANIHYPLLQPW